jgi:precorrin-3B methylase
LLHQAAAAATSGQHHPAGALYVVATPIGNLADITLRAVFVLGLVDAVACEDTRVTGQLLRHLGLDKPLIALHQHNEAGAARGVVERLAQGQRVAYASDAGTPAVSDPGAVLVAAAAAAGHRILPIPGASSAVAALSAAGDAALVGLYAFAPAAMGVLVTAGELLDDELEAKLAEIIISFFKFECCQTDFWKRVMEQLVENTEMVAMPFVSLSGLIPMLSTAASWVEHDAAASADAEERMPLHIAASEAADDEAELFSMAATNPLFINLTCSMISLLVAVTLAAVCS